METLQGRQKPSLRDHMSPEITINSWEAEETGEVCSLPLLLYIAAHSNVGFCRNFQRRMGWVSEKECGSDHCCHFGEEENMPFKMFGKGLRR